MIKLKIPSVAALALLLLIAAACRETEIVIPDDRAELSPTPDRSDRSPVVLAGRALAANCFQCHGTDGNASELKIAGDDAKELRKKFKTMRDQHPGRNIMNVHAGAYTDAQITLIGDYFSQQEH